MTALPGALRSLAGQPATVRIGTITSINPVVVSVQGAVFTDVGLVGSFTGTVGDPVVLIGQSPSNGTDPASWLALGKVSNMAMDFPVAIAERAATQSVPNTLVDTLVTFDTEVFDNYDMFAPNQTNIMVPFDGVYACVVRGAFAANATGQRIVALAINGSSSSQEMILNNVTASFPTSVEVSTQVLLNAGDNVQMIVKQNAGGALNLAHAWMSVSMVSGA